MAPTITIAPSSNYAAVNSNSNGIAFSTSPITGLRPGTDYSAAVIAEAGMPPDWCRSLGTTDDNGVLAARSNAINSWYSRTGVQTTAVVLYTAESCTPGMTPDATTAPVGVGSATVMVVSCCSA